MRPNLSLIRFYRRFRRFIFILLVIAAFLLIFYLLNFLFKIKEIQIEGVTKNIELIGLGNLSKENLIFLNNKEVERQIKANNPQIKEISVNKIFPQRIKIIVSLYKPEAVLMGANVYFYLSDDGRILFKAKQEKLSLPVIYYYQKFTEYSYQTGDWISYRDLRIALKMIETLTDLGILVERVDIGGDDMIVFKIGEKKIFLTSEKSEEVTKYELTQIIRQFKIEGKEFKVIDLRFEKPIVRF